MDPSLRTGDHTIRIELNYQACNDQSCLSPTSVSTSLLVRSNNQIIEDTSNDSLKSISPLMKVDSLNLKDIKKTKNESSVDTLLKINNNNTIGAMIQNNGLLLGLLLVFLAGLALNLTPCVYPLIPITIGYFGGQSEGKIGRLSLMGLLFMLGMAVTYSIVGVVTSLTGAVFGALLQNPIVIVIIAVIFIILSLSMNLNFLIN